MSTQTPRLTSFAPQFLVDDLKRSITYYQRLGFTFAEPWEGFYAIGRLDGLELHLKEAPRKASEREFRRAHEHLDASAGVSGIEAFHAQCVAAGATIVKPLARTPWGTKDFTILDPDGYLLCFGGSPARASKAAFGQATPELPVADVPRAQRHYRDALGFEIGWLEPDQALGAVSGAGGAIFFRQTQAPFAPVAHWVFAAALDATHDELRARGARITEPLERKPWGLRQFTVEDLDGNRFYFHCDD